MRKRFLFQLFDFVQNIGYLLNENNEEIILISGGPQQLLALISLQHQLEFSSRVSGVVSYVAGDDRIAIVDRLICECFGLKYLGSISNLNEMILKYSFGSPLNTLDTFFKKNADLKVRKYLENTGLLCHFINKCIAIPFRKNLVSDNLLLNSLKPKKVYFIPDGFDFNKDKNLFKRLVSFFMGIKNFTDNNDDCQIYTPDYLKFKNYADLKTFKLDEFCLLRVYCDFSEVYRKKFSNYFKCYEEHDVSFLIWNNIYPKFVSDKSLWIEMYSEVLELECCNSDHVVVKPHPRSSTSEIEELVAAVPSSLKSRVTVFSDDLLVGCPIEVLQQIFKVTRFAGVYSTALLSLVASNDISLTVYNYRKLPKKLRSEIFRCANMGDLKIVDL